MQDRVAWDDIEENPFCVFENMDLSLQREPHIACLEGGWHAHIVERISR